MFKRYGIPALIAGVALAGSGTAYAFGPGALETLDLSGFTNAQQEAIEEASAIRTEAKEEAASILEAAGVDREQLREAMREGHKAQRTALEEALENDNYDAFATLVASTPMADSLTEEVFARLVEIHELMASGDREGARELRQELAEDIGFAGFFNHGKDGPEGGRFKPAE